MAVAVAVAVVVLAAATAAAVPESSLESQLCLRGAGPLNFAGCQGAHGLGLDKRRYSVGLSRTLTAAMIMKMLLKMTVVAVMRAVMTSN